MAREISGTAVAVATAGAVLIYAGFRGVNPLQALRDVASGKPPPVATTGAGLDVSAGTVVGVGPLPVGTSTAGASAVGAALVAAAGKHMSERYSQIRRWEVGFSDCSSFVGKAFKDIGITPPGASVTVSYLAWPKLRKIPRAQLAAGDLCVNATHMIMATSNTSAVGQQNMRDNVKVGPPESLMWGTGSFTCLRYGG